MLSSKQKLLSKNLYLGNSSPRGVFPLYFDLLINKTECENATQTCQALKELKTVKTKQHKIQTKIMNSENAPKEIVQSFMDLANVARGLIMKISHHLLPRN